jgi:hypothetical protein
LKDNLKNTKKAIMSKRATIKRQRTKTGRDKFSHSLSLPKKQIEWLDSYRGNGSELVSRLLGDYIEMSEKTQPSAVKLALQLCMLNEQLEVAEKELKKSKYEYDHWRVKYELIFSHRENVRKFTGNPEDITFWYDPLNDPYPTYVSSKNHDGKVIFEGIGDNREKVVAILKQEIITVEKEDYQRRIDALAHERAVSESIYLGFNANCEAIQQQIDEVEKQLTG